MKKEEFYNYFERRNKEHLDKLKSEGRKLFEMLPCGCDVVNDVSGTTFNRAAFGCEIHFGKEALEKLRNP